MRRDIVAIMICFALFWVNDAAAQDCGKAREMLKDIHKVSKKIANEIGCRYIQAQAGLPKPLCKAALKKNGKLSKKRNEIALKAWNKAVKNSWATIGPRELSFKRKQKGKLVSLGGRMFVTKSATPADQVKITVKKTGKGGKTGVAICATNPKTGAMKLLKKHTFEKGKKKSKWTYTVKKAAGRAIMIHLKGKSALRGFPYTISAKEIFN